MKICWDNLEKLKYSKRTGKWYKRYSKKSYEYFRYVDECEYCNEPFLSSEKKKGLFCSKECFYKTPRSEEYRRKLSETKLGVYVGENNPNYGNKWTDEQKQKASIKLKGNGLGKERPNHSLQMLGEGNPNWQGGLSFHEYCEAWKDKEYKESIKERDEYTCQNCGSTNDMCIHHINYNKQDCHPNNLITVCRSCNAKANFNRNIWMKQYKKIIEEALKPLSGFNNT